MDKPQFYRELIQQVLQEYYHLSSQPQTAELETELLIDPNHDHYLLLRMGWRGNERIKRTLIHIRLKGEKIWIEEDATEDGVATDFLQAGVPL